MDRTRFNRLTLAAILAVGMTAALPAQAAPGDYAQTRIAASDGGWDYASVDPVSHAVYVARGTAVTVADPATARARDIGQIAKAHAVVPVTGAGMDHPLLLVTSGHDNTARLLDPASGREVARVAVGLDPDAAFYDAPMHCAIVVNAKGGTISVIDIASRRVRQTIALKPGLEFAVKGAEQALFVNNEDLSEIETADLATGKAGPVIALPGCIGPTGLAFDARRDVLISACANGKAAVVDAHTRKLVALLPIGDGPDAVILDEAKRVAFIPCGKSAVLEMIALDSPGGPRVVRAISTEPGARTGAIDPVTGTIYLPTARFARPSSPAERPVAVPGMFHILVLTPRN